MKVSDIAPERGSVVFASATQVHPRCPAIIYGQGASHNQTNHRFLAVKILRITTRPQRIACRIGCSCPLQGILLTTSGTHSADAMLGDVALNLSLCYIHPILEPKSCNFRKKVISRPLGINFGLFEQDLRDVKLASIK